MATLRELEDRTAALERQAYEPELGGVRFKPLAAGPARVYDGLTVMADGVNWNPGAGAGVYTYYGAAWNKLG